MVYDFGIDDPSEEDAVLNMINLHHTQRTPNIVLDKESPFYRNFRIDLLEAIIRYESSENLRQAITNYNLAHPETAPKSRFGQRLSEAHIGAK